MKKRFVILATGIAMTAMVIGGCSSQAGGNTSSAAETEVTTEAETAAESAESETGESQETEAEEKTEEESGENGEGEAFAGGPIKVWGTILEATDGTILADCESDNGSMGEVLLMIDPEYNHVLDGVNGFPVDLKDVEKGAFEAYLRPAMTMSLPPQTTPYMVIVNIPEDVQAPQYVVAADKIGEEKGRKVLEGMDETRYVLAEDVQILPFLTRNIVQLEDIEKGSCCLVWLNDEEEAEQIVLFAE